MKKLLVMSFVAVFVIASTIVLQAQAPQGEQGQRRGGGQREGGRGGDARGGAGAGQRGGAPQQAPMAIRMIKPGLYMVTNGGGNSTVRVTDQGVILVDTKNLGDQFYNELLAQIKTVTPQPVKYVFVTHVHQDHAGNIGKFVQAGAQVITNDGLKRNLETGGADGKGYTSAAGKPAPPNVTYTKNRKIKLGNARAEAYHFGRAHTGGDTVVYFPDVKVVSLGDEFVAAQPNADYPNGGSLLEWSKVLAQVLKLDFDTAIPGHGNDPLTKADVMAFQKKIDMIGKKAVELAKKGTPKDQIRAQIQSQTADLGTWQMTGVINDQRLDAFYDEVSKSK
jgi:glyoxylase-like metal-dependent hydrolase (beta-lactamase superfamily II)